jgi:histidinol-phosphatase (PHP family)
VHEEHALGVLGNYHTHNRWCDGLGEIADVIEAAIAADLAQVGITSHAPVPFPATYAMPLGDLLAYREEVLRQREIHRDRIDVLLGLEIDALPELREYNQRDILAHGFDFTVGSVHFVRHLPDGNPWPLDATDELFARLLREEFGGDIRPLSEEYYERVAGLSDYPGVEIVGHIDRGVRLWNKGGRYLDESQPWYRALVDDTLRALAKTDRIVELSTGGWRRGLEDPWPSVWMVRRCRELGIRMTLNSDSHRPDQIAYDYDRARLVLREAGYREIARFNLATGGWESTALD